jgi:hypothetical protein
MDGDWVRDAVKSEKFALERGVTALRLQVALM